MNQFKELFGRLKEKSDELGIVLSKPATEEELFKLEESVNQKLPKDILDFYSFSNGFESDDFIFRAIPISEILDYKAELETSSFYFAEYMIYSDSWAIHLKSEREYSIENGNHGTEEEVILTQSLYEFIEKYITGEGIFGDNGLYSWYENIKKEEK
ncbi:SMI1/KNR4 family protein [Pontibacter sp. 172403-2]|uniref:SMI1/KNR4 family protein n=1 Tax=Pontibacter rufus TaxID=2791028 RepID=UPI0018AFBE19|nr:SMI1/KNR4 family protein [Pontibacter sp. 172403-2]MBF9255824.1 SMI1/KNR4 family protein [Pontibacter sp. 172403-2]